MKRHPGNLTFGIAVLAVAIVAPGLRGEDRVIFKNGREVSGLIVASDARAITVQRTDGSSETFPRTTVRRIDDTATTCAYFAAASQSLPPWQAVVNDLRANETVKRLELIATDREKDGPLAGVPYVAFVMNGAVDLRVYGDPDNPVAVLMGLRGLAAGDMAERKAMRAVFAGFLTEREQIAKLYAIDVNGGSGEAAGLEMRIGARGFGNVSSRWCLAAWSPDRVPEWRGRELRLGKDMGWQGGFRRDRDGRISPLAVSANVAFAKSAG